MDYQSFVDSKKSLLVAPAGYGKTFTIVECLKHTTGKQLILTHTHAGIAAIKEKIKKTPEIKSTQYCIETISSFAQKYVKAFYVGPDMPSQELNTDYHEFIMRQAINLFGTSPVHNILEASYSGVFVDEYQDCNIDQHQMICAISNVLPTHILGDYMQGIFNFDTGSALVNFDKDLSDFNECQTLEIPHRWYQEGNSKLLGDHLKSIRELLESRQDIPLVANDAIGFHVLEVNSSDIRDSKSEYRKWLTKLIENPNNNPNLDSLSGQTGLNYTIVNPTVSTFSI
jgi:ATP-dependent exoDNAse (exonuclease V) beta subunit